MLLRGLRRPSWSPRASGFGARRRRQFSSSTVSAAHSDRIDPDVFALRPGRDPNDADITSAYVHLPFCKKKCLYCDFPVIALGARSASSSGRAGMSIITSYEGDSMMDSYVDALCREIELTGRHPRSSPCVDGAREGGAASPIAGIAVGGLDTIYFGGGTPSLLPLVSLERILRTLQDTFGIRPDAEISIEADPGTFTVEQIRSYMAMGVSRVSVGVQAFDDALLEACGRSHTLYDVYRAIDDIHASSVGSWSLDLISGLPHLELDSWEKNILRAVDAGPMHVSSYDLQIEPDTPFGKMYRPGVSPLPTDADAAMMYSMASDMFRGSGYEHYELSSYAKGPAHRCVHNGRYWDGGGYYAFGMGAASYIDGRRVTRPKKYSKYMRWVERFEGLVDELDSLEAVEKSRAAVGLTMLPHLDAPKAMPEDILTDAVMLQLRKGDGLHLKSSIIDMFEQGTVIADVILGAVSEHIERGHVQLVESDCGDDGGGGGTIVRLTDPRGFLMSNDVISDVFVALDLLKSS
jgi:coproporphyrinogen III oxidase-like Fe-S oxidoreductase